MMTHCDKVAGHTRLLSEVIIHNHTMTHLNIHLEATAYSKGISNHWNGIWNRMVEWTIQGMD